MKVYAVVGFDKADADVLEKGFRATHALSDDPEKYGEIRDLKVAPEDRTMSERALAAWLMFHEVGHMKFNVPHLREGLEVLDALEQLMVERTMADPDESWGRTDEAVDANGGVPIIGEPDKLEKMLHEMSREHLENIVEARKVLIEAVRVLEDVEDTFNEPEDEESL